MSRPRHDRPRPRLVRRPDRHNWFIAWTEAGRTRRLSTGTADRVAAEQALDDLRGRLAAPPQNSTIAQVIAAYLADRTPVVAAPQRLEEASRPLLAHFGTRRVANLARRDSRAYAAFRRAAGCSDGTIRRELGMLRTALTWARREGWFDTVAAIDLPPAPPPRDRWLSHDEARALVAACRAPHVRLFVLIALMTAGRKGAILSLTWERIDLERRLVHFAEPGRRPTSKQRPSVPINDALMAALAKAREAATCDNVIEFAGQAVNSIKRSFREACRRAGLDGVTPHTLRHTAATWMAQDGVDMWKIAGVLGHADVSTTSRVYLKHSPDHLRRAVGALDVFGPLAHKP